MGSTYRALGAVAVENAGTARRVGRHPSHPSPVQYLHFVEVAHREQFLRLEPRHLTDRCRALFGRCPHQLAEERIDPQRLRVVHVLLTGLRGIDRLAQHNSEGVAFVQAASGIHQAGSGGRRDTELLIKFPVRSISPSLDTHAS